MRHPFSRSVFRNLPVRPSFQPVNHPLNIFGIADESRYSNAETLLAIMANLLTADTELESLTEALVETQDRLVAIYDLTQSTRGTLGVSELLSLLVKESKNLFNARGGLAILMEKGKQPIIHQIFDNELTLAELREVSGLFHQDSSRSIINDPHFLPAKIQNIMMVSLPVWEGVFAAFGVFNKSGNFTSPDVKLAKAIAGHIGAQLENAFLHQELVDQARLETELNIARQVQMNILPQSLPQIRGLDIYAMSAPALEVGGDFFDAIKRSEDSLVFTVGDVTGKGMPAALLMSMTHTVIKSASRMMPFNFPHQVVNRLNHDLFDDFSNVGMFTTVFLGLVDRRNSSLAFCNAGHSPIYHMPLGQEPVLLMAQDIPVGVLVQYEYTSHSIKLARGDVFIVASDGFPESRDHSNEMYGYERMKNSLANSRDLSARGIVDALLADVNSFCGSHPQDDDRTILVIKAG